MREFGFLFFQDMIFMPIEILLVTFILDKILRDREKKERLDHQNIVISAFFTEAGTYIIRLLNDSVVNIGQISSLLDMNETWNSAEFKRAIETLKKTDFTVNVSTKLLITLQTHLPQKKPYIISLFSNQNLLEIDTVTNMLWALCHLTDELILRDDLSALPQSDMDHLANDIVRVYKMIVLQWVNYMKHLKDNYPYLWSLALRKNPFSEEKSAVITK
jgi:hypothetical protein